MKQKARKTRHLIFDERRIGIDNTQEIIADSEEIFDNTDSDAGPIIFNNSVNPYHTINQDDHHEGPTTDHSLLNQSSQPIISNNQTQDTIDIVDEIRSNTPSLSRDYFQNENTSSSSSSI